nr:immunoglobulin light chain junction region [Mus musculus]
CQQWNYPLYTF